MSVHPQWFVLDVNPYPWKVPPFSVGRRGNRTFVQAGRDEGLHTYKQAIAEQMRQKDPQKIEGPVELHLWFYRQVAGYTTQSGRKARKHDADNTNLQKATEDALQGFLYDNDADVTVNHSYRVLQGEFVTPCLVICALPARLVAPVFPDVVQFEIDEIVNRYPTVIPTTDTITEIPF